jgi:hypothetical protein
MGITADVRRRIQHARGEPKLGSEGEQNDETEQTTLSDDDLGVVEA